jgi:VanZ family protein
VGDIADLGELRATIGHVLAYVLLAVLFVMAVRTSDPNSSVARSAVLVVLILTGYGALLEILQGAAGSRSFQVQDVLANAAGAIVGAGLALPIRRRCFAG